MFFVRHLMSMHLQNKAVKSTQTKFHILILWFSKTKEQDVNIMPSKKCIFCVSVPLQNLLSENVCLPLWHMARRMLMDVSKNNMVEQFQLGYINILQTWNMINNLNNKAKNNYISVCRTKSASNKKISEERKNLCYCTYHFIWKQEDRDIQGVGFSHLLHHGKICLCRLSVFTSFFNFINK